MRNSPGHPHSNSKIERYYCTYKHDALRPTSRDSLEEALRGVERFVNHYKRVHLHSALG